MPKPTQKQKLQKADFSKAKLKLGKGKKQASNATDTSFKARSIALPGQNVLTRALAGPAGEPVTSAGLVLDEVLVRTRHPNAGVRREALQGIRDILSGDPEWQCGRVMRTFGAMIADDDISVRKSLYGILSWYLYSARDILAPHLPLFTVQLSSALSHIFAEIRTDAARIVSLLLDLDLLVKDDTILEGLCLALSCPVKGRIVFLTAIEKYVSRGEPETASQPVTGIPSSGSTLPTFAPSTLVIDPSESSFDLYVRLRPVLIATFLEAYPDSIDLCVTVARIAQFIATDQQLAKRMAIHFPFDNNNLNTAYCRMALNGAEVEPVTDWMLSILTDPLAPSHDFVDLRPILTRLVSDDRIYKALVQYTLRQPSSNRGGLDSFIIHTVNIGHTVEEEWLQSLPKVLWEVAANDMETSTRILVFLLKFGLQSQQPPDISPRLAAFFTLPAKRAPYTKVTPSIQRLALQVAQVWTEWDSGEKLVRAIELHA